MSQDIYPGFGLKAENFPRLAWDNYALLIFMVQYLTLDVLNNQVVALFLPDH